MEIQSDTGKPLASVYCKTLFTDHQIHKYCWWSQIWGFDWDCKAYFPMLGLRGTQLVSCIKCWGVVLLVWNSVSRGAVSVWLLMSLDSVSLGAEDWAFERKKTVRKKWAYLTSVTITRVKTQLGNECILGHEGTMIWHERRQRLWSICQNNQVSCLSQQLPLNFSEKVLGSGEMWGEFRPDSETPVDMLMCVCCGETTMFHRCTTVSPSRYLTLCVIIVLLNVGFMNVDNSGKYMTSLPRFELKKRWKVKVQMFAHAHPAVHSYESIWIPVSMIIWKYLTNHCLCS